MCKGMNLSDSRRSRQSLLEFFLNGPSRNALRSPSSPDSECSRSNSEASSLPMDRFTLKAGYPKTWRTSVLTSPLGAKHLQALLASDMCLDLRETKYIRRLPALKGPEPTFQQIPAKRPKTLANTAKPRLKLLSRVCYQPQSLSDMQPVLIGPEVEMIGIEPTTPGLQSRCSPN
jgi:hypothetical protein